MKIAGITPLSTLDFPGKLCLTVYTQGCNRNCSYCHNKDMISLDKETTMSLDQVMDKVVERMDFIDAVTFSGGEPCLQDDLIQRMGEVAAIGLLVGLHTNGDHLTKEISWLSDYILLSHATEKKIQIASYAKRLEISRVIRHGNGFENQIEVIK